jgi:hypothetical protein
MLSYRQTETERIREAQRRRERGGREREKKRGRVKVPEKSYRSMVAVIISQQQQD